MTRPFQRIAIINRGEPAVRLIRAAREWNAERDDALRTIALYTDPDRRSRFVREADEAFDLGSPIFTDPRDGQRKVRYIDLAGLEAALVATRAEAAWVGWGFVSEQPDFAELCDRLGVVFIGPSADTMRRLGDKIGSKRVAEESGVPVAPWSRGPVGSLEEARQHAERLGYPLMVKATAGGGGRGIRRVHQASELADGFESARSEALSGFGDDTVFLERLVEGARHVEVQIVGDGQGTTWALGVRDCTVQRRNQKVLEESPSPGLDADQHRELCDAAANLGNAVAYRGAGTVEFLYHPEEGFSFMEVNARLQVEHPVTEETTGFDLVKLQLQVARGERLEGPTPPQAGHSIEARVTAEDPERAFAPAPGRIALLGLPGGAGVRVDSGFLEGDVVAPEFDSMLAKVIATGRDRPEALARLRRALRELKLVIRGGTSNKGFLLGLLDTPEVRSGDVDVGWLDRQTALGAHVPRHHADVALVVGAVEAYASEAEVELARFRATAARGRPRVSTEAGHTVEIRYRGSTYKPTVRQLAPERYHVSIDGASLEARAETLGTYERRVRLADRDWEVISLADGADQLVEVEGVPHRLSRDDAGLVRAPAPAVVLSLDVEPGDDLEPGDRICVLEAMKTELVVRASFAGRVSEVRVARGAQVDAGAALVALEPSREAVERSAAAPRVDFSGLEVADESRTPLEQRLAVDEELRCLVLGFDVDPASTQRLLKQRRALAAEVGDGAARRAAEDRILAAFADICALFRRRTAAGAPADDDPHSPEEYLYLYLRSVEKEGAGLPASFLDRLRRALRHYGVESLERSPELERSLLWICRAHQRMADQVRVVLEILEGRLDAGDAQPLGDADRHLLDRIVNATRGRFQAVSDLAHEVRYRSFDRAFFERIRSSVYTSAERSLATVLSSEGGKRDAAVAELVDCPEPLVNLLTARFEAAGPGDRAAMLEVLTRRYYRDRPLEGIELRETAGRSVVLARYTREGQAFRVVTTCATWEERARVVEDLLPVLAEVPEDEDLLFDLFLWREAEHAEADATEADLHELYAGFDPGRPVRRIVTAVAAPGYGPGMSSMQHFTHRPTDGGFAEEKPYRGLHPMMGKRLQLWRTQAFEIERLPSVEDTYLFRGVARENPKDERLFAFGEVRDLTPVRDENGRVVRLPRLEMMLMEALAGIRLFQSRRSSRQRLHWNRVLLYLWPPLDLSGEEIDALARRLAAATADLGLEKVVLCGRIRRNPGEDFRDTILQIESPGGGELLVRYRDPGIEPIRPLSEYAQRVVRMRRRGLVYPYELVRLLAPAPDTASSAFPPGHFTEYDLAGDGELAPVSREPGGNTANLVVGVISNETEKHPEGMQRVILIGDPSKEMGSFSEPECRRIIAAIDLAERLGVPLEWFALSAGAKIAMDSGTENLDWTAAALRRLIEFTQAGGEVNVVVTGINVGGQSYWNAEATMLMHTRGVLIMVGDSAMVLTGKRALDYSGGVSAEDHEGIGGYEQIMGRNGEAQYFARDIAEACRTLLRYYEHAYVAPGERFPRRAATADPVDRDILASPHEVPGDGGFRTLADVFSAERNRERKRPFSILSLLRSVADADHEPLERWRDMAEAESAVVWDAHLGGWPVCMVGFESHNIARLGYVPIDGPEQWTAGTLFPLSSKKVARAINAASGNRPVVILANLSGFDGSPESMRRLQLEYGAEIGRAVVNFDGPIVFCVVSRYHGGAYVVFSRTLNENLEAAALEGSYASVIGGAPAAAVVFSGDVERRTRADARLTALDEEIAAADEATRASLRARWHELHTQVHAEKIGQVADEFESIHSIQRAKQVGSLHEVLTPSRLRPYLVDAVERGMARTADPR